MLGYLRENKLVGVVAAIVLASLLFLLLNALSGDAPQARAEGEVIPGRYIVVLQPGRQAEDEVDDIEFRHGFQADSVYTRAVEGFSARLSDQQVAALRDDPSVRSIEPDRVVTIALQGNNFETLPTGVNRIDAETPGNTTGNTTIGPDADIDIAIIDTGINTDHPDLRYAGGAGLTCTSSSNRDGGDDSDAPSSPSAFNEDDNGHGSHVAGTAAARDNAIGVVGVAPGARLWSVKVLNAQGSGDLSCVIAGIDWVTNRRAEFNDGAGDGDPGINIAVANMSLRCLCFTSAGNTALNNSVNNAGVIYVVAAGNDAANAVNFWPANHPGVITVSAIADYNGAPGGGAAFTCDNLGLDDSLATFSNDGSVVDIAAPGVCIDSTYGDISCTNCYAVLSGTSMAAPHVAGAVARFKLETGYSGSASGPTVVAAMTAAGWTVPQASACGFTGDTDGSPEPLVWLGASCGGGGPTPTPTPTPTPDPTPTPTPGTTAWLNCTNNAAVTSGSGDNNGFERVAAGINAAGACADGGDYAEDVNSGTNSSVACGNTGKDRHTFGGYNASSVVPAGSTINGIEVRLDAWVDLASGTRKMCVELSWDGGASWTATKITPNLTTAQASYILGSSTDTWGRSWSLAELANLRVRVTDLGGSIFRDFRLDWAAVRISYTAPP